MVCSISLAGLLTLLPNLKPRRYSFSSSSVCRPGSVTLTVGVLKTKTIEGVCSNYLANLRKGEKSAQVTISPSQFRLATDISGATVFVAAGTGIAPIMGFLKDMEQARRERHIVGTVHLFFGCRETTQLLYHETLIQYETSRIDQATCCILTIWSTAACSRFGRGSLVWRHLPGTVLSLLLLR